MPNAVKKRSKSPEGTFTDVRKVGNLFPTEELLFNLENVIERLPLLLFCPLHFNKEVIGYIAIAFHLEGFLLDNTGPFLINTNQILEIFKNRKMPENANTEMAVMHITDSMTNLFNRRVFYIRMQTGLSKIPIQAQAALCFFRWIWTT